MFPWENSSRPAGAVPKVISLKKMLGDIHEIGDLSSEFIKIY